MSPPPACIMHFVLLVDFCAHLPSTFCIYFHLGFEFDHSLYFCTSLPCNFIFAKLHIHFDIHLTAPV